MMVQVQVEAPERVDYDAEIGQINERFSEGLGKKIRRSKCNLSVNAE